MITINPFLEASVFLKDYVSPPEERSAYKGIPISLRDHEVVKALGKRGAKIRYRGPRPRLKSQYWFERHLGKSTCLKENATHFSIYLKTP